MMNIQEKKNRIISFLKEFGPSLPVRIGKVVGLEPFLSSTIMGELMNEKKVNRSEMKIGASSLFFLEGQEKMLENFTDSLKSVEKAAYLRLKEYKVLEDEKEEPVMRVTLRSIRDFAIPFKYEDKIMWRYAFSPKEEIQEIIDNRAGIKPKETPKIELKEIAKEKVKEEKIEEKQKVEIIPKPEKRKEKVVKIKEEIKLKEDKIKQEPILSTSLEEPKGEFYEETVNFLKENKIEFLEEIQTDKKEVVAKVRINSDLGKINFLLIARNKKSIQKEEINSCIQRASYSKMPCLLLLKKGPSKAVQNLFEGNSLIKMMTMS